MTSNGRTRRPSRAAVTVPGAGQPDPPERRFTPGTVTTGETRRGGETNMHAFDNGAAQRQAEHWRRAEGLDKPEDPSTLSAVSLHPGQRRARTEVGWGGSVYIDIVERQPGPAGNWLVRYPDDVTMTLWGPSILTLYPNVVEPEVQEAPAEDAGDTVVVAGRVVTERDLRDAVTLFRDLGVVLTLAYEVEDVSEDEAAARNHVSKLVQAYVDQLPPESPTEAQEAIREHLSRIAH